MNIPNNLAAWEQAMSSGDQAAKDILRNVRDDQCVPAAVEQQFFAELAATFAPGTCPKQAAARVVHGKPDDYTLKGDQVVKPPASVSKFQKLKTLVDHGVDKPKLAAALRKTGLPITEAKLEKWPDTALVEKLILEAAPWTFKKHGADVVYVADAEETDLIVDSARQEDLAGLMIDWLGLNHLTSEVGPLRCVCFSMPSTSDRPLHVPRVLDGIDFPPFWPQPAGSPGRTRSITDPESGGLWEAVHRAGGAKVAPTSVRVCDRP